MTATALKPFRTLVLNADYRPLSTWPLSVHPARKVLEKTLLDKYDVVETWPMMYRTEKFEIALPKVAALKRFVNVYNKPKFCRRSILLRDRWECQYCGEHFESDELTFDHVVPKAAGGQTVWDNIVMACVDCNKRKRDKRTMKPLREPRQPTTPELLRAGLEFLEPTLRADFSSWLYWDSELKA